MKQLIFTFLALALANALLMKCANPKSPTGGPKDTIPPTLVNTTPEIASLNVKGTEFILEFDELISIEKLSANLIITPNIDIKYKSVTKKNKLIIKFEQALPDSTTITLNFFDGLTDITEKNPAVNLSYVFSTGPYLDSLQVSGSLKDLLTTKPLDKVIVGLYPFTDSLEISKVKPMYFTSTNKEGRFLISNIKKNTYKVVAFTDDNRNLQFDPSQEAYGFIGKPIQLDSNITDLKLSMVKINAEKIKRMSSKANGGYFDTRYNKPIDSVTIDKGFVHQILDDKVTLRIYKPDSMMNQMDSVQTIAHAYDSLINETFDTLYVKFNDQVRKATKFEAKLTPKEKNIETNNVFEFSFTKPVTTFKPHFINWQKDSIYIQEIDTSSINLKWNTTKTKLRINNRFDTTAYLSFQRELNKASDSLKTDTTVIQTKNQRSKNSTAITRNIDLVASKEAFISVQNDTLPLLKQAYTFIQQKETGKLLLKIETETPSYQIQIINKQFQVIRTFNQNNEITINNLIPGDYGIRILIDDNQDGAWSYGNILKDEEPESIYLYPDFTSLRANWEVTLDISF